MPATTRLQGGRSWRDHQRLPAQDTSPAVAREIVGDVIERASLSSLRDSALLLTTELVSNAVVHSGAEFELEVTADSTGVTVAVADNSPIFIAGRLGSDRSTGYGLLLVDLFATRWGVVRRSSGKTVWVRIDSKPHGDEPAFAELGLSAIDTLLEVEAPTGGIHEVRSFAHELVTRLGNLLHATAARVYLDQANGAEPHILAGFGPVGKLGLQQQLPLAVRRPWTATLAISGARDPRGHTLIALAAERLGIALESERLHQTEQRRQNWLTFQAEVSELLAHSLDVNLTMALVPHLVVPRLGQWCAMYVAEGAHLRLASVVHEDENAMADLVSRLDSMTLEEGASASHTPLNGPVNGFTVPLVARGQRIGLLAIGRDPSWWQDPSEFAVAEDVARRAALAVDNARIHAERQSIATTLQQGLLPPELPAIEGIDLAAAYVPVSNGIDVGGDFYDVLSMHDGRWLLYIGDVCGKGIRAAAATGFVRDVMRILIRDAHFDTMVLSTLNEVLTERDGPHCTLALAALQIGDHGKLHVSLHLAGHDRPLLLRNDGAIAEPGIWGTALGLLDTVTAPVTEMVLEPGESLVFFTDGLTDRRNGGEPFGLTRVKQVLEQLVGYPVGSVAARLKTAALEFSTEPPRDDIAIVVLRNSQSLSDGG